MEQERAVVVSPGVEVLVIEVRPRDLRAIPSRLAPLGALLGLLLIAGLLRAPTIGGPGYALDEEITVFAVRGIQRVGLPLFPSGVLSDRGLPFSYAAWIAGAIVGQDLQSYRLVSLLSGLSAVVGLYLPGSTSSQDCSSWLCRPNDERLLRP